METKSLSLRQQVLLAAAALSGGDPQKTFSAEDLLLEAWRRDPHAWGLRGHEVEHPDSDKMRAELDRANVKGGMVGLGLLERVHARVYRLTPAGMAKVATLANATATGGPQNKAHRAVEEAIKEILGHPVFQQWLTDANTPKRFRDAGKFWGIAAGTPPTVVRERVQRVEHTLRGALELLSNRGVDEIAEDRRRTLFERADIDRCLEFQRVLKARFATELRALGGESVLTVADSSVAGHRED